MTILTDLPAYYIETASPRARRRHLGRDAVLRVVRKADGAFFNMDSAVPEATHELLWLYAHGDDDLPSLAEEWIAFFVAHDPRWVYPTGAAR